MSKETADDKAPQPGSSTVDYTAMLDKARSNYRLEDVHRLNSAPIYRGPDMEPVELKAAIDKVLNGLTEAKLRDDGTWDLSNCQPAEILGALDGLTADNSLLLHGGKSILEADQLDPAKSRQHQKSPVVNATSDAETAAYYASFDFHQFVAKYFPDKSTSFNFGIGLTNYGYPGKPERSFELQTDSHSNPVFSEHGDDPDIYSDGYIFVLDRSDFRPSDITPGQQSSDHEWSATHAVTPMAVIRIAGKKMGPTIITPDKVVKNEY